MKLWLISQNVNEQYDTYDCAVVAAPTAEYAKTIHPGGNPAKGNPDWGYSWAPESSDVKAVLIGEAVDGTEAGTVLCASFNAG